MTDTLPEGLTALLPAYVSAQRWFAGPAANPDALNVARSQVLWDRRRGFPPAMACLMGVDGEVYQLVIGERPVGERMDFLHGREEAVLGSLGSAVFYDAVLDFELARVLLRVASDGAEDGAAGPARQCRAVQHLPRVR